MRYLGLAVAAAAAAIVVGAPAHAAGTRPVAFVRTGSIYLLSGTRAVRLTRDADDKDVYIEFAAVFLELRYFAPNEAPELHVAYPRSLLDRSRGVTSPPLF